MALYLVTGGAGFIGSHLVEHLVRRGDRVRVLDSFLTGNRANLEPFLDRIELIEDDIRDEAACARATDGADYVLHQAALPSVPRSVEEPVLTTEINVTGTVRLLKASADAGVKRFLFAASSSAYGDQDVREKREDLPTNPLSPYAAQKLAGESFCRAFYRAYGLETVCLRYFNIFGPRQDPDSPYSAVIPLFLTAMIEGRPPLVHGDGMQSRDFTYVENAVRANMLALEAPADKVAGRVFNVGCGESFTLLDLVRGINEALGTDIAPDHGPARAGDVRHSLADISAARAAFGYDVTVPFAEGLRRTLAALQPHTPRT